MLLLSGAVIYAWQRAGEARVTRQPLKEIPAQLGQWHQTRGVVLCRLLCDATHRRDLSQSD